MKSILLIAALLVPSFAQEFDPAPFPDTPKRCAHQNFMVCWDGCRATQCGGIGATILGFEMYVPGAWYSSCSSTGMECSNPTGGYACQVRSITLTYPDCFGNQGFLTLAPCCERGFGESTVAGRDPIVIWPDLPPGVQATKATCAVAESLLPIPVMEVL